MSRQDPWLTRLRFLLGSAAFAWEVAADHHDRWWIIVISLWLLGGPIEEIVRFLTAGRLQVSVKQNEEGDE